MKFYKRISSGTAGGRLTQGKIYPFELEHQIAVTKDDRNLDWTASPHGLAKDWELSSFEDYTRQQNNVPHTPMPLPTVEEFEVMTTPDPGLDTGTAIEFEEALIAEELANKQTLPLKVICSRCDAAKPLTDVWPGSSQKLMAKLPNGYLWLCNGCIVGLLVGKMEKKL